MKPQFPLIVSIQLILSHTMLLIYAPFGNNVFCKSYVCAVIHCVITYCQYSCVCVFMCVNLPSVLSKMYSHV